jgi:hypothetical protein
MQKNLQMPQTVELVKRLDAILEQVDDLRAFASENELETVDQLGSQLSDTLARFGEENLRVSVISHRQQSVVVH